MRKLLSLLFTLKIIKVTLFFKLLLYGWKVQTEDKTQAKKKLKCVCLKQIVCPPKSITQWSYPNTIATLPNITLPEKSSAALFYCIYVCRNNMLFMLSFSHKLLFQQYQQQQS